MDVENEKEQQRRLAILLNELKAGKIHFAPHLHAKMSASIEAVRIKPDGTVDLSTVDASIRSMAFMSSVMKDREDMKAAISIYEINKIFYDFLELNMGWLIEGAKEHNMDAHEVGLALSASDNYVEEFFPNIKKYMEMLDDLWQGLDAVCQYHLQDFNGLKAIFGGDLFPSYQKNIASSSGLYLDVIALNDPFSKSRHVFENGSQKQAVYIFAKHVINLMNYKDLALCDEQMPIIAIVPPTTLNNSNREWLGSLARADTTKHLSTAFGRTFNDIAEVDDFLKRAAEPEEVVTLIDRKDMILFDVEWKGDLLAQMKRSMADVDLRVFTPTHAGRFLTGIILGRMGQATDILQRSRDFGSIPLLDAPTSWRYFNFALAHQSTDNLAYDRKELHIVHGLQRAAATDAEWLGNIPPSALIEMRKQGAMPEIRQMLSKGISELAEANPDGFYRTADQLVANVQEAFELHKQNIQDLKNKRWKFLGHDIGGWLVTGTLEIGAAVLGTPVMGVGAFVAQNAFDLPNLKDLPKRNRESLSALDHAKRSPIGLLFSHRTN